MTMMFIISKITQMDLSFQYRTYRKNTHVGKKQQPVLKEESDTGHSFQTNRAERPNTLIDITEEPDAAAHGHKGIRTGPEKVVDLSNPSNHTYAVLEGPALPLRRHKTQSAAARKKMASNRVKRFSDVTHNVKYDGIGLNTESRFRKKSAHVLMSARPADDNETDIHQYAVLEGPTPVIEHSDRGILREINDSTPTSGTGTDGGTACSTYDKLAPKTVEISTENNVVTLSREDHSDGQRSTQVNTHDRFGQILETSNPLETVHMYDTLEPEKKNMKPKVKSKRNSKKKLNKKPPPTSQVVDASHIYDTLEFKNELESCAEEHQTQETKVPAPPPVVKSNISRDRKVSCEGISINAARKRKLTHSLSSRTICDVTEARKRAMTVFAVASDTNLNRIDTESEAHIYDTVEVFPISQRKRKRSGKRYRWLHLKEQLQKQQKVSYSTGSNPATPTTSGYVTEATCMTTSSSSVNALGTPLTDSSSPSEVYAYASLDKTQTYAQVGPFVPCKKGSIEHLEPAIEESSEYAHLQHH